MGWLIGGLICAGLILVAIMLLVVLAIRDAKKNRFILENGEQTHGWLVMANMKLFETGESNSPGVIIIAKDPEVNDDEEYMTDLAERIMDLKDPDGDMIGDDDTERAVSKLISDERYIQGTQTKLPKTFTDGREIYLVHIFIYRNHLPRKRLKGGQAKIPCAILWGNPEYEVSTRPVNIRE